nr:FecR domain-containing protein [Roseateles oligotrophus]
MPRSEVRVGDLGADPGAIPTADRSVPNAPDPLPEQDAPSNPTDPIAARAIAWAVQLRSGEASAADHAAFDAWRRADPRHEAAAARMERALGRLNELPQGLPPRQAMRRSLLAQAGRRSALRNTLGLVLAGVGGGLLWSHGQRPLSALAADFSTGTGERRVFALADGSRLWLNARSVVDQSFDGTARRLHLRSGELIVEVAKESQEAGGGRPFIVHTAQGHIQALGTRFLVRQDDGSSLVAVLHSAVRIEPLQGQALTLAQGHSARLTAQGVAQEALAPQAASAWEDGFVEVHDRPLQDVVDALRPYHPGVLRVSPQAARLRVTGSFPLDDSERTLAALARALPITVHRRTGWWVSIDLR